jgi:hypothetical protein
MVGRRSGQLPSSAWPLPDGKRTALSAVQLERRDGGRDLSNVSTDRMTGNTWLEKRVARRRTNVDRLRSAADVGSSLDVENAFLLGKQQVTTAYVPIFVWSCRLVNAVCRLLGSGLDQACEWASQEGPEERGDPRSDSTMEREGRTVPAAPSAPPQSDSPLR